ncbi:uncharacterized protein LODBEIA_P28670 [Lodderomyces beijingensis]|uniref:Autophagy-related protein 21 n=1 Tax=Lodderomyces beijingensis TaxID=1775926 RepID=A0ABP0ZLX9_9ASCO
MAMASVSASASARARARARINDLAFNSDYSCISVSTDEGHKIFNCEPFGEIYSSSNASLRKSLSNSLEEELITSNAGGQNKDPDIYPTVFLKMLFSTSLTVIVPQTESNNLLKIYNLKQHLKIVDLTFSTRIVDVKLNRKRLVVVLGNGEVHIYDLSCIKLVKILRLSVDEAKYTTFIGDLSSSDSSWLSLPISLIADSKDLVEEESGTRTSRSGSLVTGVTYPNTIAESKLNLDEYIAMTPKNHDSNIMGTPTSNITLEDLQKDSHGWVLVYDTINLKPSIIFKAHDSGIAKISMSHKSHKIATASVKGTILRVFEIEKKKNTNAESSGGCGFSIVSVKNLRRGHNTTKVNTISFNNDDSLLGCGSESNTVHLFEMRSKDGEDADDDANSRSRNNSWSEYEDQSDGEANVSSTEDLNESLANLLFSKPSDSNPPSDQSQQQQSQSQSSQQQEMRQPQQSKQSQPQEQPSQEPQEQSQSQQETKKSWFNKTKKKLLDNQYTNSIFKKIPYKDYLENLIWEPPRRSFAYIKLPEPHHSEQPGSNHKYEIGFCGDMIFVASHESGIFYHYQLPKKKMTMVSVPSAHAEDREKREECVLVNKYELA